MPGGFLAGLRDDVNRASGHAGLRVERIVIEGRANTPEPILHAAIGIARGEPILAVPLDATRTRIEGLTWVQSARVERRLPNTIVVSLTERRPFAIWQFQGKFRLVDRAGQVVDQDLAEVKELPLIVGAGAPAAAAPLLDLVGKYPALLSRMVAAVRVGERRWNLRLNTGADVMLPEGAEQAALERLMTLHQGQALLDRPLKAVDMRLPDRLVVRPSVEPKPDDATRGAAPRKPT
jgi:cell division protein FtsQ